MKTGDLVEYQGVRWKVARQNRNTRMCALLNWDRGTAEVPDDRNDLIICHPPTDWPFVAIATKTQHGPLININRDGQPLVPLVDWVPSNMLRHGGSVFFNPELGLRQLEVLVGEHRSSLTRITITRAFGTVQRRRAQMQKVEAPRSAMERILDDDLLEDD